MPTNPSGTGLVFKPATGVSDKAEDSPGAKVVQKFHQNAAVDSSPGDMHHTIGTDKNQASPGNHTHEGKFSKALGAGTTITGSRSGGSALTSVIAALVQLGFKDSTIA